jgi:hypothetical protein
MFEHMKNYSKLLEKVSGWLKPGGKLFVHIFTHKWKPYHFEKGIFSSSTISVTFKSHHFNINERIKVFSIYSVLHFCRYRYRYREYGIESGPYFFAVVLFSSNLRSSPSAITVVEFIIYLPLLSLPSLCVACRGDGTQKDDSQKNVGLF